MVGIHVLLNFDLFFLFIYATLMDGIFFCPSRAVVGDVWSTILKCTCELRTDEARGGRKYCIVKSLIICVLFMVGIAQSVRSVERRGRGWTAGVRFPVGAGAFLYSTTSRTTLEAHPASCPIGTEVNAPEK
jgi:uncharacterized integral membrane protein